MVVTSSGKDTVTDSVHCTIDIMPNSNEAVGSEWLKSGIHAGSQSRRQRQRQQQRYEEVSSAADGNDNLSLTDRRKARMQSKPGNTKLRERKYECSSSNYKDEHDGSCLSDSTDADGSQYSTNSTCTSKGSYGVYGDDQQSFLAQSHKGKRSSTSNSTFRTNSGNANPGTSYNLATEQASRRRCRRENKRRNGEDSLPSIRKNLGARLQSTLFKSLDIRARLGVLGIMVFCAIIGVLTAHSYFNGQPDTPACGMSYMRPRFIKQTKFDNRWTRFSEKYSLYLYREGGYDAFDDPSRIPVLFIPGNAGSHKQVRSIAAASTAHFVEMLGQNPDAVDQGKIGFDYFTVGLNEEFTALHGYSILEQANFINDAIRYILSLYPKTREKHKISSAKDTQFALPESVVVVAHSMGGVVARTAFTLPNHIVGSIQAIFTLSTPHNNPTASLEYYVENVYNAINSFWHNGFHNGTLDSVSLVSIAGGNLDSMINSDYTYVGDLAPSRNSLSILTSGINDVWLSVDHQSILWCSQMVKKFTETLALIMDARSPSQITPLDQRMAVLRRQLYSPLEPTFDQFDYERNYTIRETSSDSYIYTQKYEKNLHLTSPDLIILKHRHKNKVSGSDNGIDTLSESNPMSLHIIPIERHTKGSIVQVLYNPWITEGSSDDTNTQDPKIPGVVGCSGTGDITQCKSIPVPPPASIPMQDKDADPNDPIRKLNYIESSSTVNLDQFDYLGIEMPADPGSSGFLIAATVEPRDQIIVSPGYFRLMQPYKVKVLLDNSSNIRTSINFNVPENPLIAFKTKLKMYTSDLPVAETHPRWRPIVRQSDSRMFETKYWYDPDQFVIAIHGRGSYTPDYDAEVSDLTFNNSDIAGWNGLDIDIWADTSYYSALELTVSIDWYSSLNRLVKRYDMALLAFSFIWTALITQYQLRKWNKYSSKLTVSKIIAKNTDTRDLRQSAKASDSTEDDSDMSALLLALRPPNIEKTGKGRRFLSSLEAIERLIRNGMLLALIIGAIVTVAIQESLVHSSFGESLSPSSLASLKNLFVGFRGDAGWMLCAAPVLLVIFSLGFVAAEAIVITVVCTAVSWLFALCSKQLESTQRYWERDDIIEAIGESCELPASGLAKIPVRPLVATVVFVLFVCTFVPYQFAFLVIYLSQLITAIRTMTQSRLAKTQLHASITSDRLLAAKILQDRANYQVGLLLFWTSSLPYCVPELLVWVRNLSVMWFEDAPSDHNLANMAGYFALRLLAAHHVIPRVSVACSDKPRHKLVNWVLMVATYSLFSLSILWAWLYSIRRPYTLYNIANMLSAWLALVQFIDYPLKLFNLKRYTPVSSGAPSPTATTTEQSLGPDLELHTFSNISRSQSNAASGANKAMHFNKNLNRKLR